jgi:hypothetical protein
VRIPFHGASGGAGSGLASLAFVAAISLIAWWSGRPAIATYGLAYWHYYLYALAFLLAAVPHRAFMRDAIAMKAISLALLGYAYLAFPLQPASVAVVLSGFLLNGSAARALGAERTYYGHEAAGMPYHRVTAFPYSRIAHPMLVGNMLAFGGTLLHDGFRERWWPLAAGHVALNLGLLAMETGCSPGRGAAVAIGRQGAVRGHSAGARHAPAAGALAGGALGAVAGVAWPGEAMSAVLAAAAACGGAYATVIFRCYSTKPRTDGGPRGTAEET